jgi:hypothetical protein
MSIAIKSKKEEKQNIEPKKEESLLFISLNTPQL